MASQIMLFAYYFVKNFVRLMESSIAAKLNECLCNITADDLQDTSIVCNGGKKLVVTTQVTFSTESGDESASTLTNRLTQQASVSSLTIPVSGSEAVITSACSDDCFHTSPVVAIIGSFGGGALFSAVCIALIIAILLM